MTFWRNLVLLTLGVFFLGVAVLGGNQLLSQARSSWASDGGVIGDDLEQPDL